MKRTIEDDRLYGPDGTLLLDFDRLAKRFTIEQSGWDAPDTEYITERGPAQNGETALAWFLNPRVLQYIITENACDRAEYWQFREELNTAVGPFQQMTVGNRSLSRLQLIKTLPTGSARALRVVVAQGPRFTIPGSDVWQEYSFTASLRFVAHDPVIFDPVEVCLPFTLETQDELVFPITFSMKGQSNLGIMFGSKVINAYVDVLYTGSFEAFPTIEITGPLSGFSLINEATNTIIHLNYSISAGQTVTFRLPYGNKTVMDQNGVSLIGAIADYSDFVNWSIVPAPLAPGGLQRIRVVGSNASPATAISIAYYTTYVGI